MTAKMVEIPMEKLMEDNFYDFVREKNYTIDFILYLYDALFIRYE